MRRIFLALILLSAAAPAAAGEHPWDGKRIYYVMEYMGTLREKGYFVRRQGSYEKQPCTVYEEEKFTYSAYDTANPARSVHIRTLTTPDGEAIQRSEQTETGEPGTETVTVENGEARFEASGFYGSSGRIPAPPGTLFEITGEWLASHSLRPGAVFTVDVLDRSGRTVAGERVEIRDRIASGDPEVWLAEFSSPGRPPMTVRFTADGRLLRMESGGLTYQVVSRDDYDRGRIPRRGMPQAGSVPPPSAPRGPSPRAVLNDGDYLNVDYPEFQTGFGPSPAVPQAYAGYIPIGESVPAWDNFAWVLLFAGPPYEWGNVIRDSAYSQIEYSGVSAVITAVRNAPRVDAGAVFPMAVPPEIQPYLSHTEAIPSNHPAIIEAAYRAVADADTRREEENILRAVSYLAGWINQNIAKTDWTSYGSSPVDALSSRTGDSLAHARLFAAMARTLGVPTRICQGLLTHSGRAVHHCWAEAWVNGTWVPVDTTVSRVGLPAGYILAEQAMGDGHFSLDFENFLRTPGLTLSLASAGRETPGGQLAELRMQDRSTYAFAEDDWLANLYWGFALRLPPNWIGTARLNSVEMTSPDRKASVKCEALSGDYRAGREELDSNIASLRSNLSRFRLIDSRVVSFDTDGATPALYMDFSCVQDGISLRCRQYVVPRRQRAFRISFWAEASEFSSYTAAFDGILAAFEF